MRPLDGNPCAGESSNIHRYNGRYIPPGLLLLLCCAVLCTQQQPPAQ
jgi:hypothetical protein